MKIKEPYHNQANYIVYFPKDTTSLNELKQKVIGISNIVVYWHDYRSPKRPTLCHKCQMFGHGSRNCNLSPKCVKCGGNHITVECNVDCDENDRQNMKCANCGDKHVGSYSKCPSHLAPLTSLCADDNQRTQLAYPQPNPTWFDKLIFRLFLNAERATPSGSTSSDRVKIHPDHAATTTARRGQLTTTVTANRQQQTTTTAASKRQLTTIPTANLRHPTVCRMATSAAIRRRLTTTAASQLKTFSLRRSFSASLEI